MAIVYTYIREKDIDKITVEQDTTVLLEYTSYSKALKISEVVVLNGSSYNLPVNKDGEYLVTLNAVGEVQVTFIIFVRKNLQISIVTDVYKLLCDNCGCGCDSTCNNCIKADALKCLKHRGIFVKLLSYQHSYLHTYPTSYLVKFNYFIKEALKTSNCNIQVDINKFLMQECITGDTGEVLKLFKLYIFLYWYIIYRVELEEAVSVEEQEFVTTKYKVDKILACVCDLCVDINKLDEILIEGNLIYYWQFSDLTTNISIAPSINQVYLDSVDVVSLEQALTGNTYGFNNLGRIAFAIPAGSENAYSIFDNFGVNVTAITFDTYYNTNLNIQIYISKEYYSPSNFYFKLVEN